MTKGDKMPPPPKRKMIKSLIKAFAHKAKPIIQRDKKGNIITEWKSLMELERIVGQRRSHVADVCKGRRKSAYGFLWKYK